MEPRRDILDADEPTLRKLFRLSWPVSLSMLFHTSYSLVDMYWVSSLGTDAVAAVTLAGLVFWLGFAVSQVFAGGAQALVARAFGAGRLDAAGRVVRDSVGVAFVTGVLLALTVGSLAGFWLKVLDASPSVAAAGVPYVQIGAIGFIATLASFTVSSVFRATGDMVTPLWLNGTSCLVNLVLDPLLIFGYGPFPALGIAGAAWASVIAAFVALVWGVLRLGRVHPELHVPVWGAPDWGAMRDLFAVGIPSGLHYVLLSLTQTVMVRMTAAFGTEQVAAAGIGARVAQISFLPCMGIGAATATLVGQYLGARRPHDADACVRAALRVNLLVTAAIGVAYAVFPQAIMGAFTEDASVVSLGTVYLRLYALAFLFVTSTIVLTRVFQGAGDTIWPTVAVAFRFVLFLGLAWYLGWRTRLAVCGVWVAMGGSSIGQMIFIAWLYRRGSWKHKRLASVDSDEPESDPLRAG